jgi:type I restriction enzyme S subunit
VISPRNWWPEVSLNEVAAIERSSVQPSEIAPGTTYVGLDNIESGGRFINMKSVNAGELGSSKFRFTPRHLLYGKLRPYLAKIACPDFSGICSTDIVPILPGAHLDRQYLFHYLRQPAMVDYANSRSVGINLPRLAPSVLIAFRIPIPPLAEQRRIADVLDRADGLRAKRRAGLGWLEALADSIFHDLLGDPMMNPQRWPRVGIAEVCELIVDCVNRTAPVVPEQTGFKMIRTTNIKDGTVSLKDVRHVTEDTFRRWNRRATPRRGDLLLTREAPVGEAGILDSDDKVFLGQRIMLYRPDPSKVTPEYMLSLFRSPFLRGQFARHGSGSTVKHLSLPVCRNLEVLQPPLGIQEAFSERLAVLNGIGNAWRETLSTLDTLFASLQHRAFRGEL